MENISEFLEMGGYGAFVWPAYGAVALVLLALLFASRRFVSSTSAELASLTPDRTNTQPKA